MITQLHGDCRTILQTIEPESVQAVITSPPYFGLRDYGVAGQIGLEPIPDCLAWARQEPPCASCYVCTMRAVFAGVWRVLKTDGVVFLNIGDSYAGSSQTGGTSGKEGSAKRAGRMFKSARASGPRASAYGSDGKALGDYPSHDCLCESLCGVCRVVYRNHKSRNDGLLVSMLTASLSESTLERTGLQSDRLPTSDSLHQEGRRASATVDSPHSPSHVDERLLAVLASMLGESSQLLLGACLQRANHGECLLCARSLAGYAQASVDRSISPDVPSIDGHATQGQYPDSDGTGEIAGALDSRKAGTVSGFCSCLHYTTQFHHLRVPKPKNLLMIPARVALALQSDGWIVRSDIVWAKGNPMPESVKDRPTRSHETIYLLAKQERYYYDAAAVAEPAVNGDPSAPRASHAARSNGRASVNKGLRDKQGESGLSRYEGFNERWESRPQLETRNLRDVWQINPKPFSGAHFAVFPEAIPERCIRASTRPGDVVLDPFGGSGTTARVATRLQRDCILIELNEAYIDLQDARTDGVQVEFL